MSMACVVMCFIVIMISYGINWLSINEYAPIRHHLQQVNQELAAKYNNETITITIEAISKEGKRLEIDRYYSKFCQRNFLLDL